MEIDKRKFPLVIMVVFVLAITIGVLMGLGPSHGEKAQKQQGMKEIVIVADMNHDGDDSTANINI